LLSLRISRRWDYDDGIQGGALRTTDLVVARATHDLRGRWTVSAHAASRRDSFAPRQNGLGAELGFKLSKRVALALGYNLRGIDDSELAIDDRLAKGVTLRLQFSIEAALARWLDPPLAAAQSAGEGPP
jgi:hypothetical protein